MSVSGKEAEGRGHSATAEELERLYQSSLANGLSGTLMSRYGLSNTEAESVIQDALFAYIPDSAEVVDAEGWVRSLANMRAAALQRRRALEEPVPVPGAGPESARTRSIRLTAETLAILPDNARKAVWMAHHKGWPYEEIAAELEITVQYAKHLVAKSIAKIRAWHRKAELRS